MAVQSLGSSWPKAISTRVPTWELRRLDADHRGAAIALRAKLDALVAGGDSEVAFAGQDRTGDHAQAVAERAAGRPPQQLGGQEVAIDGVELGNVLGLAVEPWAIILDEIAAEARQLVDVNAGAGVQAVVAQFLEVQLGQLVRGDAGASLQPFEVAEGVPVLVLEREACGWITHGQLGFLLARRKFAICVFRLAICVFVFGHFG